GARSCRWCSSTSASSLIGGSSTTWPTASKCKGCQRQNGERVPRRSSPSSAWKDGATTSPSSSPVACNNGSASPEPSPSTQKCCSSTSRSRLSTLSFAATCRTS